MSWLQEPTASHFLDSLNSLGAATNWASKPSVGVRASPVAEGHSAQGEARMSAQTLPWISHTPASGQMQLPSVTQHTASRALPREGSVHAKWNLPSGKSQHKVPSEIHHEMSLLSGDQALFVHGPGFNSI